MLRFIFKQTVLGIFLVLMVPVTPSHASPPGLDPWGEWKEANALYDSKKYDEALQNLQTHPRNDFSFYYNLGTIHLRLGHLGPALAYLEKANHLHPHDSEIQSNLALARSDL